MRLATGRIDSMWPPCTSSRSCPSKFSRVALTIRIVPSSANDRKPHGAVFNRSSIEIFGPSRHNSVITSSCQIFFDDPDGLFRMAHVWTMARSLHHAQRAFGQLAVEIIAHLERGDSVVGALHDERRHQHLRQIAPVVGEESYLSELARGQWVGRAEAFLEFESQLRPIGILHDRRR